MKDAPRLLQRAAVPLIPAALTLSPQAEAQVVYTPAAEPPLELFYHQTSSRIFFDLDHSSGSGPYAQTGSTESPFSGADFGLGFVSGSGILGTGKTVNALNVEQSAQVAAAGGYALKFGQGANISDLAGFDFASGESTLFYNNSQEAANWKNGDTGYLGLKLGDGYGWAGLTVGAFDNELNRIHLHDFAFNPNGGIAAGAAGAIPEPAASAILAAALAGSAALFRRRRRQDPAGIECAE